MPRRFVPLLAVLFASAVATAGERAPHYTASTIWLADPLTSLNAQSGPAIPAGTPVSDLKVGRGSIRFTRADTGETHKMEIVEKYHGEKKPQEIADRFFTTRDFAEQTRGLPEREVEMIRRGEAEPGMSRRAVLMALGVPAEHRTPSIENPKWIYWTTRRGNYAVAFDPSGIVVSVGRGGQPASPAEGGEEGTTAARSANPAPSAPTFQPLPPVPPSATPAPAVPPREGGDRWAVVVGVSRYQYAGKGDLTDLAFADDDARDFAALLKAQGWSDSHIRLLVNEEATFRNITVALEAWLTKARPDDMIVLFWSGHGFPDPDDTEKVYFACHDTDITVPATGYRMDRVHAAILERGARHVVVIADTCHAGRIATRGEKGVSITSHVEALRESEAVPKGWIYMVGADADRQAVEDSSWSNGAFTHVLLEGMKGAADGYESMGEKDGVVTMNELKAWMRSRMPDLTQRTLGVAKHPLITTSSGDPEIWQLSLKAR